MTGLNLHLNSSMGCFFIGILLSIILYGLTCAQVLYYIWEYPIDSRRIRLLVRNYHLPRQAPKKKWYNLPMTIVMVCSLLSSAHRVKLTVLIQIPKLPDVFTHTKIPGTVQPAFALITDIYITVTLIWTLNGEKTGFEHTNMLINRLMLYAVNRGIVTAYVETYAISCAPFQYVSCSVDVYYWAPFHYPGSKRT
ncbi:uncharacterized protein LAESUDRAFT_786045 [Laetiporus sulphureus 93-53]|uniref:DUF6534 domain-containing protein n=1 Tax=Laetiporus sulphureus 93-53 TaxID=1314785 RepID=A0A165D4Q8_9APHY|nr:uncharacterized protein LAESUDRAFT_786045 [Laetiporus sulphureus 93-53]KZT04148.1 hypothetical protein LAESUDRAFT_786045 [Laetiporus sulphureus 93-53]